MKITDIIILVLIGCIIGYSSYMFGAKKKVKEMKNIYQQGYGDGEYRMMNFIIIELNKRGIKLDVEVKDAKEDKDE